MNFHFYKHLLDEIFLVSSGTGFGLITLWIMAFLTNLKLLSMWNQTWVLWIAIGCLMISQPITWGIMHMNEMVSTNEKRSRQHNLGSS